MFAAALNEPNLNAVALALHDRMLLDRGCQSQLADLGKGRIRAIGLFRRGGYSFPAVLQPGGILAAQFTGLMVITAAVSAFVLYSRFRCATGQPDYRVVCPEIDASAGGRQFQTEVSAARTRLIYLACIDMVFFDRHVVEARNRAFFIGDGSAPGK